MTRIALLWCLLVVVGGGSATAQKKVRLGIYGVGLTYAEINEEGTSEGAGVGGSLIVRWGRFGFDGNVYSARVDPDATGSSFDIVQGDLRISYAFAPALALEIGVGRRRIDPDFAAQDIGIVRVGFLSEMSISRIADIWGRGAYLVNPQFSGGGDAELAIELGIGVAVGFSSGRFRVRTDYEFQRIDRKVNQMDVPIQIALARLGLEVGF